MVSLEQKDVKYLNTNAQHLLTRAWKVALTLLSAVCLVIGTFGLIGVFGPHQRQPRQKDCCPATSMPQVGLLAWLLIARRTLYSRPTMAACTYNAFIFAGGTLSSSPGFHGSWSGSNGLPTVFILNGATCMVI